MILLEMRLLIINYQKLENLMKSLAIAVCTLAFCGNVLAQQPREKPKELEALGQYVGDWTSDVTSKPAVWTPQEIKYRTSNHAEFVLGEWYLQHMEVNHVVGEPDKVTKALMISTFDPQTRKYVTWFFQSSGLMNQSLGDWNHERKTLTFTQVKPRPNTTNRFTETFATDSTINGSLAFTGNDGRTMFDMVWTRTRQNGADSKTLRERWSEIGTPIQPIPNELRAACEGRG